MQYGVNPKTNMKILIGSNNTINPPKAHYRTISGFRNIKGKPHFFSTVEVTPREEKELSVVKAVEGFKEKNSDQAVNQRTACTIL